MELLVRETDVCIFAKAGGIDFDVGIIYKNRLSSGTAEFVFGAEEEEAHLFIFSFLRRADDLVHGGEACHLKG